MKLLDWQTMQRRQALEELRRLVEATASSRGAWSERSILGRIIAAMRKGLWKLLGLRQALHGYNAGLLHLLAEIEQARPVLRYQLPEHAFSFRPETHDWDIFTSAFLHNEYGLPETLEPDDIIIDIGTHIGSFAYLALVRGAGRIYGFEPDRDNFELATRNLHLFGERVCLQRKAVWRSDQQTGEVYGYDSLGANTGGGSLLWVEGGEKLELVALDDLLDEVTEGGCKRVRVLKVDCEGAEYPILLTARKLHLVDTICGEYHEIHSVFCPPMTVPERARVAGVQRYDRSAIVQGLERAGFAVQTEHYEGTNLGLFFATRRK